MKTCLTWGNSKYQIGFYISNNCFKRTKHLKITCQKFKLVLTLNSCWMFWFDKEEEVAVTQAFLISLGLSVSLSVNPLKVCQGEPWDTADGRAHMLWVSLARYTEEYFRELAYLCLCNRNLDTLKQNESCVELRHFSLWCLTFLKARSLFA